MNEKVKKGLLLSVIVIYFVLFNTVFAGGHFTCNLNDGHNYRDISYEVLQGDATKFSAELKDSQTIKVKYKGDFDVKVILTLTDENNESIKYQLRLYEKMGNAGTETTVDVESELIML